MQRLILTILAGLFALSSSGFSQYGSQGQHYLYSGDRRIAVIMLAWQDTPCPTNRQTVVDRVWNNSQSTRKYFLAMSRGLLDCVPPADAVNGVVPASTSAVYGPYTLSIADGYEADVTYNTLVENGLTEEGSRYMDGAHPIARQLAAERDGFDAQNYDYIIYITPKGPSTGSTGGYAGVQDFYQHIYVANQNYINHEMGHSLGLAHSNTSIDVDGYGSQDCVMGNANNPHLDAVHTYNLGWYPDDVFSVQSYGQYTIENLAQPGTDNVKVVRFDRSAHNAITRPNYDLWVSYRVKGVGHDSSLNNHWDRKVNIHYCLTASDRPSDPVANSNYYNWWGWVYYYTNNNVAQLLPGGNYTDPDGGLCKVRFLREDNPGNQSAVIQLIDPNGNQPPSIPSGQNISVSTASPSFTITASDPENNPLTYSIVEQPSGGTLTVSGDTFTFSGTAGTYTFKARVNDGQYDSSDQVITFHSNTAPTVTASSTQTTVTLSEGTYPWTPADITTTVWYDPA
ncbi:MAG: Ig-like domain-containing protein, partial [Akkermansiaceae bacterium]|nr:Ig-like domain-containing protein [Akkermansiaceae bacterium]